LRVPPRSYCTLDSLDAMKPAAGPRQSPTRAPGSGIARLVLVLMAMIGLVLIADWLWR